VRELLLSASGRKLKGGGESQSGYSRLAPYPKLYQIGSGRRTFFIFSPQQRLLQRGEDSLTPSSNVHPLWCVGEPLSRRRKEGTHRASLESFRHCCSRGGRIFHIFPATLKSNPFLARLEGFSPSHAFIPLSCRFQSSTNQPTNQPTNQHTYSEWRINDG